MNQVRSKFSDLFVCALSVIGSQHLRDDLDGLKSMALMHKLEGEEVELWDLELGVKITEN